MTDVHAPDSQSLETTALASQASDDPIELMTLTPTGPDTFRCLHNERNHNNRVFGGQLIAQTIAAAMSTVEAGRTPTALQLVFLAGARSEHAIDYEVTRLQDGKRFATRHISARQGSLNVIDAHMTFQTEVTGLRHQVAAGSSPAPEQSAAILDAPAHVIERLHAIGYVGLSTHPFIDCRFAAPETELLPSRSGTTLRYWLRVKQTLNDDALTHAAALGYLSDWWINYVSIAYTVSTSTVGDHYYVASLNHAIWFHAPFRADEWLQCVTSSPWANSARGLAFAYFHRQDGTLVATIAQEALQALRD